MMNRFAYLALLPALLFGSASVEAHANLQSASPAVGSTVGSPPAQVSLTFSQNLERKFSRLEVRNASGDNVDSGGVSVTGNTMRVGVKG